MQTRDTPTFDLFARAEPLLLFLVFYLPGYLAQSHPISGRIFNSVAFNLTYLVVVLPRIGLLLYLMLLRAHDSNPATPTAVTLDGYGVVPIHGRDLGWVLIAFLGIEIVVIPLSLLASAVGNVFGSQAPGVFNPTVHWQLTKPGMLPLVLLTSMTIGYSEELFFRSYLLTTLSRMGIGVAGAVAASTALFALGHIYEGLPGIVGTAAIGVILSLLFLRKRNIHIIAIAHGLYNFVTLLATLSGAGIAP